MDQGSVQDSLLLPYGLTSFKKSSLSLSKSKPIQAVSVSILKNASESSHMFLNHLI